ncbi:hypothetical protein [Mucilaginibacter lappiensis]|uniref:hypothetical protein n=1 Tax=Mucilaginibacter lappiensis TaxID=354630 RepID=UPI003D24EF20
MAEKAFIINIPSGAYNDLFINLLEKTGDVSLVTIPYAKNEYVFTASSLKEFIEGLDSNVYKLFTSDNFDVSEQMEYLNELLEYLQVEFVKNY